MISKIKKIYPNIYRIIVAIAIALWFNGISIIIDKLCKNDIKKGFILSFIALLIFYLDDFSLSELYNYSDNQSQRNAAGITGAYDYA